MQTVVGRVQNYYSRPHRLKIVLSNPETVEGNLSLARNLCVQHGLRRISRPSEP